MVRRDLVHRNSWLAVNLALLLALILCPAPSANADRVLVVTTESPIPSGHFGPPYTAELIVTDLVSAGLCDDHQFS